MLGGKGTTQTETKQSATNQQVATESGIALGAGSYDNNIQVNTLDAGVAKAAIENSAQSVLINAQLAGQTTRDSLNAMNLTTADALSSNTLIAQRAIEGNAVVSNAAFDAVDHVASLSILSGESMAGKYADTLLATSGQQIGLLQSVSDSLFAAQRDNNKLVDASLGSAMQIAGQAAPVSEGNQVGNSLKVVMYVGVAAIVGFVVLVVFKKK